MSDFNAAYPGYETTARLDELRATEYSYLDEGGHVYLDYTGAGLPARSQLRAHAARIRSAGLPTGGAVRVSLGVASTLDDVDAFLDFAERTYRDRSPDLAGLSPRHSC